MRTIPTKVLEMLLDPPTLRTAVESTVLMAAYCQPWPDLQNLRIGHNRISAKADKVDSMFSTIKDHVTLRRTFGKYHIVIPNREEWGENWPNQLRKGHVWFTDGRNLQIPKQNTVAHFTRKGCYILADRGCGNTGLCN